MTRYDPNRGAPNAVLLIVAWLWAALRLALAGLGLIFLMGYLLQSCGRSVIHF